MIRRSAAAFVLSSLIVTACGSRPVVIADGGGTTPVVTGRTGQDTAIASTTAATPFPTTSTEAEARRAKKRDGLGFGSGPGANNTMPLTVLLSRRCARPGQEMSATATSLPGSKLAFAAAYSDNDIVPDFTYTPAEANPTGTFTWTWVIRPTIPPGDAVVSVVAAKGNRGATFEAPFRVAHAC